MSTIVTRSGKGSPLTNAEMDANLNNLNNDKLEGPVGSTDGSLVAFDGITGKLVKAADTGTYTVKTSNTGSSILPSGTTAQRDGSPATGYLRFNSTLVKYEGYDGASWQAFSDVSQATETSAGIAEISTSAEAIAGTNDLTFITPLKLRNGLNASGTAPVYACRAWVNFNGTGTVAIRAAGNVSSITDNGIGDYTATFTNAMPDANYAVAVSCTLMPGGSNVVVPCIGRYNNTVTPKAASNCIVSLYPSGAGSGASLDSPNIDVAIFR